MVQQVKGLHLGCGLNTPEGWINLDGSWNARLAKHTIMRRLLKTLHMLPSGLLDIPWSSDILIHDVRKSLPFQCQSLCAIYASHLLEHLYLEEAKRLLKECFRTLQPGGVLRMVVPDLRAIILEYMEQKTPSDLSNEMKENSRADRLNKSLSLRNPEPPSGNIFYRVYTAAKNFHIHKWAYDADSLAIYFGWAGFVDVREMQFHQSRIEEIQKIEQAERVLNGAGVCIEGIKPHTV